jgi:probable rRNA maturation factor
MRELNRQFLEHDYATDVLSFVLESSPDGLEGEIVISADTAAAAAGKYGWRPHDELLLYSIHGALHLAGWDDADEEQAAAMRLRERHYLASFGLLPPATEEALPVGSGGISQP